jgi:dimethylhistidine N-methyltransferase
MHAKTLKTAANERIHYVVRSTEDPLANDLPNVVANLTRSPKKISSVYVYDKTGTALFEQQCGTPEYYLRRVETELLRLNAGHIFRLCGPVPIVELGAGTAEKTRILLAEYGRRGLSCDYFPIDVDVETLAELAQSLVLAFPLLSVHCVGTTYEAGLRAVPAGGGARLLLFLGSSIGNMEWPEVYRFLSQLFECGVRGDYLLLGADLDKDPAVIDRAYNDSAGFGPRSTLNVLDHLNRRYRGNFQMSNFAYRSTYDPHSKRNDVRIESLLAQTVTLAAAGLTVSLGAAELIDAEVMLKFDPDELGGALNQAGFLLLRRWIDPVFKYALFLMQHP